MLSKELFVRTINNIQKQREKIDEFNKALDILCDGFPVFDDDNLYLKSLLELLQKNMGDTEDYIGWWLYEDGQQLGYK